MSTPNGGTPPSAPKRLPVQASEENLRKQAKRRAKADGLQLVEAQRLLAREYGFDSWAKLVQHVVEMRDKSGSWYSDPNDNLPKAANDGNLSKVRSILASGQFSQHDLDLALGRTACGMINTHERDRWTIADLLIDHGADPNGQYGGDYGPIIFGACEFTSWDGIKYLIDHGADVSFGPIDTKYGKVSPMLHLAGTYSRGKNEAKRKSIDLLLEHGAFVPPEITPELMAIHRGDAIALTKLLDDDPTLASRKFETLPYVNLAGGTLLHYACEYGQEECIELLLSRGGNLNERCASPSPANGGTPISLLVASWAGAHFNVLRRILERHADQIDWSLRSDDPPRTMREKVEICARADRFGQWRNFYKTAAAEMALLDEIGSPAIDWSLVLFELVRAKKLEAAEELLGEHKADVNARQSGGMTVLHVAAKFGPAVMVRALLDHGASPSIVDAAGKTTRDYAMESTENSEKDVTVTMLTQT